MLHVYIGLMSLYNYIHDAIYSHEVMLIFRPSGFMGNVVVIFESLKFEIVPDLKDLENPCTS